MHSGGFELTKLTHTRLEDNLIRHRDDRCPIPGASYEVPVLTAGSSAVHTGTLSCRNTSQYCRTTAARASDSAGDQVRTYCSSRDDTTRSNKTTAHVRIVYQVTLTYMLHCQLMSNEKKTLVVDVVVFMCYTAEESTHRTFRHGYIRYWIHVRADCTNMP